MDPDIIRLGNLCDFTGWKGCNNSASCPSSGYIPHGLQAGSADAGGSLHDASVGEDAL